MICLVDLSQPLKFQFNMPVNEYSIRPQWKAFIAYHQSPQLCKYKYILFNRKQGHYTRLRLWTKLNPVYLWGSGWIFYIGHGGVNFYYKNVIPRDGKDFITRSTATPELHLRTYCCSGMAVLCLNVAVKSFDGTWWSFVNYWYMTCYWIPLFCCRFVYVILCFVYTLVLWWCIIATKIVNM